MNTTLHIDTAATIDESAGADPTHPLNRVKRSTRYEISVATGDEHAPSWLPVGMVDASSAKVAIRDWYEEHDDEYPPPCSVRAVPAGYITQVVVAFETHKQLTFS